MKKKLVVALGAMLMLVVAFFVIFGKEGNMLEPSSVDFIADNDDELDLSGSDEEYFFLLGYEG